MVKVITAIAAAILFALALFGYWYISSKEYDYNFYFKTSAPPGSVYHKLVNWEYRQLAKKQVQTSNSEREFQHELKINNTDVLLDWSFIPINDSVTRVEANIKSLHSPFAHRLKLLFNQDPYKGVIREEVDEFRKSLKADFELFRIKIEGITVSPATSCACISFQNQIEKKGRNMMASINYLSDYVLYHKLEPQGRPRIQVNEWNIKENYMDFDFCFPLKEGSVFPADKLIFHKEIPSVPALKATFFGNYFYSHQAWMKLLNYAELHDIEVERKPQEIFLVNPELGGDGRNWKAEVYLPILE